MTQRRTMLIAFSTLLLLMLIAAWMRPALREMLPASGEKPTAYASIPFANLGGIAEWRADGERGIYPRMPGQQWYYAQFMTPCAGLAAAEEIGFITNPSGSLDRFSAVTVGRNRCYVANLAASEPPR